MTHTPIDAAALSPAAQKALGSGPARMMAARGLAPLANPADLITVLYQIAVDPDPGLAAAARTSAAGLPDKILGAGLADVGLDARVLDWYGVQVAGKPALHDAVVTNPATSDATIAALAGKGGAREVDLIAENEQRLLRHPAIIAAMYTNARARMSTVDRAVELAVRNQVRVPELAAWDDIARALQGGSGSGPGADALFEKAAANIARHDDTPFVTGDPEQVTAEDPDAEPEIDEDEIPIGKMSIPMKIRLATLGNAFARALLVRDPVRMVSSAAIKAPGVTDIEAARYAGNQALDEGVIRYIAGRREWTKLYGVKLRLIMNPKTPIADAARLLPHLREKDLRNVAKSKGVPSAVAAQARKLFTLRGQGGK